MTDSIRRLTALIALTAVALAACASTPSPLAAEASASEAIAAARHVAYWLDVDVANVRHPDALQTEEIARLRAAGARLSAQAEALEQELEAATVARMERKQNDFMQRGGLQTRLLKEQTIQVRTQWEAFLRELDRRDLSERPVDGAAPISGDPSGTSAPPRPGRGAL